MKKLNANEGGNRKKKLVQNRETPARAFGGYRFVFSK